MGEDTQCVRIEVTDVDGRPGRRARPPAFVGVELGDRLAPLQSQGNGLGEASGRVTMSQRPPSCWGENADGLFADGSAIAGLCGAEEIPGHPPYEGIVGGQARAPLKLDP